MLLTCPHCLWAHVLLAGQSAAGGVCPRCGGVTADLTSPPRPADRGLGASFLTPLFLMCLGTVAAACLASL